MPYKNKADKQANKHRARLRQRDERPFIFLDGEGDDAESHGQRQNYILFGASTGERLQAPSLPTRDILSFLMKLRMSRPEGLFVMYGMGYDVDMWLKDLTEKERDQLIDTGKVCHEAYVIRYYRNKIFELNDTILKKKMTIFDVRGFWSAARPSEVKSTKGVKKFLGGFIAALDKELGRDYPDRQLIIDGKLDRGNFAYADISGVDKYMTAELDRGVDMMNSLRAKLITAGWTLKSWHGSGAIANHLLREHDVTKWMPREQDPEELWAACNGAFYGGWIELSHIGYTDRPIYQRDINSAYPWAMTLLPDMDGDWAKWVKGQEPRDHALYYITWWADMRKTGFASPHPFSFRQRDGSVLRPPTGTGWVHGVELITAQRSGRYHIDIHKGLEYHPADPDARPFSWVQGLYDERLRLKQLKDPAEMVLKTGYATLYGKLVQHVGTKAFQNLFLGGEITARTRALLWETAMQNPKMWLSSMTDCLYTFEPPDVKVGTGLGEWSDDGDITESVWCQAGVVFTRKPDQEKWDRKAMRGYGTKIGAEEVLAHMADIENVPPPVSHFTTFITMTLARQRGWDTWRRWVPLDRTLDMRESQGKRVHNQVLCEGCMRGKPLSDMLHVMMARSHKTDQPESFIIRNPADEEEMQKRWAIDEAITDEI